MIRPILARKTIGIGIKLGLIFKALYYRKLLITQLRPGPPIKRGRWNAPHIWKKEGHPKEEKHPHFNMPMVFIKRIASGLPWGEQSVLPHIKRRPLAWYTHQSNSVREIGILVAQGTYGWTSSSLLFKSTWSILGSDCRTQGLFYGVDGKKSLQRQYIGLLERF